jgi:hypothetical protein
MGRVRNGSLKGRQVLDADWNERKIITVLGEREGRALVNTLNAEQAMAETANQALGNSATSRRLDNPFRMRGAGVTPEQKGVIRNMFNFKFGDAAAAIGDRVMQAIEKRGASNLANEVGPLLTAKGARRDAIIRALAEFDRAKAAGRDSEAVEALISGSLGTAGRAAVPVLAPQ